MKNLAIPIVLLLLSCFHLSAQNPNFNYLESEERDGTFVEHNGLIFQIVQEPTESNAFGKVTICPWTVGGEEYKYKGDIVIPKAIQNGEGDFADKYRVIALEDEMFDDCDELASVIFPEDMDGIIIHGFSFENTSKLKSVKLPKTYKAPNKYKSKYLDEQAFLKSGIEEITIPDIFEHIGEKAFLLSKLKKIDLPESLISIGGGAFASTPLTTIFLPQSVCRIDGGAFMQTLLTSISLPNSIIEIGSYAFAETPLAKIHLPPSLSRIYDGAFAGTLLTTITFNSPCIGQTEYDYSQGMFSGCPNLTEVIFAQPVGIIPKNFFRGVASDKLTIKGDIKELGEECFSYSELSVLCLPMSVEIIGENCFDHCSKLKSLELPDSLKIVKSDAFSGTSVKKFTVPKGIESIEYFGFGDPDSIDEISIKCSIDKIPMIYLYKDSKESIPRNIVTY